MDTISGQLVLANGDIFHGKAPTWQRNNSFGEVVFNTGMTGYEEALTDPSYSGQILTFTYPILGNYGVSNGTYWESRQIHTRGIICQTIYKQPFHHAQNITFLSWLKQYNIPILFEVDTRALTKVIRDHGVIDGVLVFDDQIPDKFENSMAINWVARVSPKEVKILGNGKYKVILVDCGAKQSIINNLLKFDIQLKIVPYNYDYSNDEYDGVFLSNGPGDPKQCITTITILQKALAKTKPVYGICLGSQLMGLAIGANTYKLKFGHRGQNQPCIEVNSKSCYLTSQNHGYALDATTLPDDWEINFKHLNDGTVAGIAHKTKPFNAVQFHPEAAPGPHDTFYFFEEFFAAIEKGR